MRRWSSIAFVMSLGGSLSALSACSGDDTAGNGAGDTTSSTTGVATTAGTGGRATTGAGSGTTGTSTGSSGASSTATSTGTTGLATTTTGGDGGNVGSTGSSNAGGTSTGGSDGGRATSASGGDGGGASTGDAGRAASASGGDGGGSTGDAGRATIGGGDGGGTSTGAGDGGTTTGAGDAGGTTSTGGDAGSGGDAAGSDGASDADITDAPAGDAGSTETPCGATGAGALSFVNQTYSGDARVRSSEAVFSFINTLDDPTPQTMRLHNGGAGPITVTSLGVAAHNALFPADYRQHSVPAAFRITPAAPLPVTIPANGDLSVQVQFLSTQTNPPPRTDNTGGEAVAALLVARSNTTCSQGGLYGVSLWNNSESINGGIPSTDYARFEPTLGQILATIGYRINVGVNLKSFVNVNQNDPTNALSLPPLGDGPSDELIMPRFTKVNAGQPVTVLAIARFSPKLNMPYGYYPIGSVSPSTSQPAAVGSGGSIPAGLQVVGIMSSLNNGDPSTSDHSEMVLPPIVSSAADGGGNVTTFDPGATPFGLWAYTGQRSYGTVTYLNTYTPTPTNGDYMYSEDALNVIAAGDGGVTQGVHRARVYQLLDRSAGFIPDSFLVAWEEAANGDYQDYVFIVTNVKLYVLPDAGGDRGG